jgi:hypothetical protein
MTRYAKQYADSQAKAELVAEFIEFHGRLPKNSETYKDIDIGSFVSRARSFRSKLAMDALTQRGIDYTENMRWPKYGSKRIQADIERQNN